MAHSTEEYAEGLMAHHGEQDAKAIALCILRNCGLTLDEGREATNIAMTGVGWDQMLEAFMDREPTNPFHKGARDILAAYFTSHLGERK